MNNIFYLSQVSPDFSQTEFLLNEWGKWSWQNNTSLGYTSNCFAQLRGTTVKTPCIEDEIAIQIDSVVAQLNHRYPLLYKIAMAWFVEQRSSDQIAKLFGMGKPRILKYKDMVVSFVAAVIEVL